MTSFVYYNIVNAIYHATDHFRTLMRRKGYDNLLDFAISCLMYLATDPKQNSFNISHKNATQTVRSGLIGVCEGGVGGGAE